MKKILYTIGLAFFASNFAMAVPTFYYNYGTYEINYLYAYYSSPTVGMGCYDGDVLPLKFSGGNVLSHLYTGVPVPANQLTHAYVCGMTSSPVCSTTTDVIFKGMRFGTSVTNFAGFAGINCSSFTQVPLPNGWQINMPTGESLTYMDLGFMAQYIFQ